MKKILLTILLLSTLASYAQAQAPQLINFQTGFRTSDGLVMASQSLDIMIILKTGSAEGETVYTETQSIITNSNGIANIVIGSNDEAEVFLTIPWNENIFVQIDIKLPGEANYTTLDTSPILSVPYAIYTNTNITGDPELGQTLMHNGEGWIVASQLVIDPNQVGVTTKTGRDEEEPIFLVRNSAGQIVFAVYESGVDVKVEQGDEEKGTKGGFAVGGLSDQTKLAPTYLSILPDEVQFNILQPADSKSTKGGFAVGGLSDQTKLTTNNILNLSPDSVTFLLQYDEVKATKGGFAVGGLSDQTKGFVNWLRLNRDTTFIQTQTLNLLDNINIDSNLVVAGVITTTPVKDIDGNIYKTIPIGNQVWMSENLKTTRFRNGVTISTDVADTALATVGVYDFSLVDGINTDEEMVTAYGRLYNWKAISNSQGLCPAGWALPTYDDWNELIELLQGDTIAGALMKSKRVEGVNQHPRWNLPNTQANNISGFTGLPGGYLFPDPVANIYSNIGLNGYWWSQEEKDPYAGLTISLAFNTKEVTEIVTSKYALNSVRCIKVNAKLPVVVTSEPTDLQTTSAIVNGTITNNGGSSILKSGVIWGVSSNPTIENNIGNIGSSPELTTFSITIEGLDPLTTFYAKAYATNKAGTTYGNEVVFTTPDFNRCGTVTDMDGNTYQTIQIADQCWMAENLKTTKYFDGSDINSNDMLWEVSTYYPYEPGNEIYGIAYNGIAALSDSLCPNGWLMPTEENFIALIDSLGGSNIAGEKLKSKGNSGDGDGIWNWPNPATNASGFTALPGGTVYSSDGIIFQDIGSRGVWWSNTEDLSGGTKKAKKTKDADTKSGHEIIIMELYNNDASASIYSLWPDNGANVRCIWGQGKPYMGKTTVNEILINQASITGFILSDGADVLSPITERGIVIGTTPEPTIDVNAFIQTEATAEIGEFNLIFTGLTKNTIYYVRAYATNANGTTYSKESLFKTYNETVSDIEDNVYFTTLIGDQHWMAEDLRTTQYNSGTPIANIPDPGLWASAYEGAYVAYEEGVKSAKAQSGYLYNWYTVSDTICPIGWRVPFAIEWDILEDYLGENAGGKLKSTDTAYWDAPNTMATNESGFTGFGTGYRTFDGYFYDKKYNGFWWTSTSDPQSPGYSLSRVLYTYESFIDKNTYSVNTGLSIRCIEDTGLPIVSIGTIDYITLSEAYISGNVDYEGTSMVTEVGMVWDINPSPTLATNEGSVIGVPEDTYFGAELTGLQGNTKYYARAYATNETGTSYSSDIMFTTASEGLTVEDFESGTFADVWIHGDPSWIIDNTTAYEGTYSARSSDIDDGETAEISMTFFTLSGSGSFYLKTSSESGYDNLTFSVNGETSNQWSGEQDWQFYEFSVGEGYNTFRWDYSKDGSVSSGSDCAWIDSIVFPLAELPSVIIGTQKWMAHNLSTTEYLTSELIYYEPHGSVPPPGNYYSENPTPGTNAQNYGYAYSMGVANDIRGVCPMGWLVPSREDWVTLFDFLGGQAVAGGKMKTVEMDPPPLGDGNWLEPNTGATNESEFSAVPAGYRGPSGEFFGLNTNEVAEALFWSSTILPDTVNYAVNLTYDSGEAFDIPTWTIKPNYGTEAALSIRCIEDDGRPSFSTAAPTFITDNSAVSGGEFLDFGDYPIIEKGVVWSSVSDYPTLLDNEGFTQEGTVAENFSSNLTGLETMITYRFRAYVTTSQGTTYGYQIRVFETLGVK